GQGGCGVEAVLGGGGCCGFEGGAEAGHAEAGEVAVGGEEAEEGEEVEDGVVDGGSGEEQDAGVVAEASEGGVAAGSGVTEGVCLGDDDEGEGRVGGEAVGAGV